MQSKGGASKTSFACKGAREKRRYAHAKAAGRGVTAAEHHAIAQAGDIGSDTCAHTQSLCY